MFRDAIEYVQNVFETKLLRALRALILTNEVRVGNTGINVAVTSAGVLVQPSTFGQAAGKVVYLFAVTNDVYLDTDGGFMSALDGTRGTPIFAGATYGVPHTLAEDEKTWHAVSPSGNATLKIRFSQRDGLGVEDPGLRARPRP